uniref:Uncharacterized protein n=1 Tax=Romanomermis culicivorax TaxID=13658 RepID=A0A915J6H9_ROMCU
MRHALRDHYPGHYCSSSIVCFRVIGFDNMLIKKQPPPSPLATRNEQFSSKSLKSQVAECPPLNDGSRSENAVLSLCRATDYPMNCGNTVNQRDNKKNELEMGITIDAKAPHFDVIRYIINQFDTKVADQWCGVPFNVRQMHNNDLTRYFEIGSFTQNPDRVGFLNSAQYVLKGFVHRLAKTIEDIVHVKDRASFFTDYIKDWQSTDHT